MSAGILLLSIAFWMLLLCVKGGAETPPEHFEPLPAPGGREPLPEEEKPRARRRKDAPVETGERNDSPEAPEVSETGEAEKEKEE